MTAQQTISSSQSFGLVRHRASGQCFKTPSINAARGQASIPGDAYSPGSSKGAAAAWGDCRCTAALVTPESLLPVSSQGQTESLGGMERISPVTSNLYVSFVGG